MDKKEILKIESKKNNDEYVKQAVIKSNWIALIIAFSVMFIFMIVDFAKGEEIDLRPLIMMASSVSGMNLYMYIKTKEKQRIIASIIWLAVAILNILRYISVY